MLSTTLLLLADDGVSVGGAVGLEGILALVEITDTFSVTVLGLSLAGDTKSDTIGVLPFVNLTYAMQ